MPILTVDWPRANMAPALGGVPDSRARSSCAGRPGAAAADDSAEQEAEDGDAGLADGVRAEVGADDEEVPLLAWPAVARA